MAIPPFVRVLLVLTSILNLHSAVEMHLQKDSDKLTIQSSALPSPLQRPAELVIERSTDLRGWLPQERTILPKGHASGWTRTFETPDPSAFFRLRSRFDVDLLRADGADVLGFGDRFALELQQIGQISPAQFASLFSDRNDYLPRLSWDPTTAEYYDQFQTDFEPDPYTPPWRVKQVNFKLNDQELNIFKTNGFVVTGRITQTNFCDLYYDIFVRDLPVFVTTDSLLHAWFRSYETMLIQLEELYLFPALSNVLSAAAAELPVLAGELANSPLNQNINDLDLYLTVARSLAAGQPLPSARGQQAAVDDVLAQIDNGQYRLHFGIFDRPFPSPFDFSQFKVRGHYDGSPLLQRYFKAMMWCGRMDFRIAGNTNYSSPRELGTALLLTEVLRRSGQLQTWRSIDETIQQFIGAKDSMDPDQMEQILRLAGHTSVTELKTEDDLRRIKSAIEDGHFGVQEIIGESFIKPFGAAELWLPRSFGLLGQRFTMDGWALGKVLFDRIHWYQNGASAEVIRRRTSALDAAFAVLQNNVVTPEIVARIEDRNGLKFRDGLPYQHNLAAARNVIDAQEENHWDSSLYNLWLDSLRTLSEPTTGSSYPEVMRTRPWALRRLNTQLGSWTQLRHASILYAKPNYVPSYMCSYPAGFVEPMPQFWAALRKLVDTARQTIDGLPMQGEATWHARQGFTNTTTLDLAVVKSNQLQFLARFSTNLGTLRLLSEKELAQQPFSPDEETFLLDLVEVQKSYEGVKSYRGWYPRLFYGGNEGFDGFTQIVRRENRQWLSDHDASKSAAIVADIVTAPPDLVVGDPGAVLHQAIGKIHFMLVAIDNGPDKMVYGAPVYSHYEFHSDGVTRLNDTEWESKTLSNDIPPSPTWTRDWLVP